MLARMKCTSRRWRRRTRLAWLSLLSLREMVCLFAYEHGMTYSAIARELGITRGAVQNYVERAREKLVRAEGVQLGLWRDDEDEEGNFLFRVE
ncbi:sigma factor-like helix-turn-helix DNA-binding protein [Alicyclobacillus acidocaldarius]|uniref:Transcriptional regulator, LuxR family n=1 Tax=Alicyclobacillus acidocaldarius subsp. acidocaldarius (strain ATCC 27009 / DSM 446 / BCRC 14685 / JCM 5260 / KCTC 1825 / NBRC 15652 / NCIMB 11725 / NRRL B-14509 / 104-IA) TaxID=521098 RepID=C8WYF8_ALIAD|nr:transcriptional regulator, LuxR family [Alicyclobacillus acidocaldarius subsp. acidocaldarius DSM 446]